MTITCFRCASIVEEKIVVEVSEQQAQMNAIHRLLGQEE